MDDREVGEYWDGNADAWTKLARAGYDVYRDFLNTPWFFGMLPDVTGLAGLDIGCGEGHNTRLLAKRGAKVTAVDVSPKFIAHAKEAESNEPLGIHYHAASGTDLPFDDEAFDFATAFVSLMDMAEVERALDEVFRTLKPGGFFQFSITHPCTTTPDRKLIKDEHGRPVALRIGRYFEPDDGEIDRWLFGAAPAEEKAGLELFRTPRFHRTLSGWLNAVIDAGFIIERIEEPVADDQAVRQCPDVEDTRIAPYFLHIRCRKPG